MKWGYVNTKIEIWVVGCGLKTWDNASNVFLISRNVYLNKGFKG